MGWSACTGSRSIRCPHGHRVWQITRAACTPATPGGALELASAPAPLAGRLAAGSRRASHALPCARGCGAQGRAADLETALHDAAAQNTHKLHARPRNVRECGGRTRVRGARLEIALLGGLAQEREHSRGEAERQDDLVGVDVLHSLRARPRLGTNKQRCLR